MRYSTWLTAITLAGALAGLSRAASPALANPSSFLELKPMSMTDVLTPTQPDAASLNRLANEIQRRVEPGGGQVDAIDTSQFPWLDALLDDNGEVNLPLGITVFDAMGATSVGFGSKF